MLTEQQGEWNFFKSCWSDLAKRHSFVVERVVADLLSKGKTSLPISENSWVYFRNTR